MSLWTWFFPTPEDRVRRARQQLAARDWAAARAEIEDVDTADAEQVRRAAEDGLASMNLDLALTCAKIGDEARVRHHLELAERFLTGDGEERVSPPSGDAALLARLRDVRRQIREERQTRDADLARAKSDREASSRSEGLVAQRMGGVVPDHLAPDDEERRQRLALVIENYPKDLRHDLEALGAGFADAIGSLDEGRPDLALQQLDRLPEHPLVCWEQAIAALGLGDPKRAITSLRRFATLANGHRAMGNEHSAVLLSELLARTGEIDAALSTLSDLRTREPKAGGVLFAQLLEARGRLPEAEAVLRDLVARAPTEARLAMLLARVRVAGGHRVEAMAALERQLSACCSTPGRCGSPVDPQVQRDLATLYFEDRRDLPRARELADAAARAWGAQGPQAWEDGWMLALWAQDRGETDLEPRFERLWHALPLGDPRRDAVLQRIEAIGSTEAG